MNTSDTPNADPSFWNGKRILVVDDQPGTVEELKEYWECVFPGIEVKTAISRAGARKLLDEAEALQRPFHIIVLDYELPEEDGDAAVSRSTSLAEYVEARHRHSFLVQFTGFSNEAALRKFCEKFGHNPWINTEIVTKDEHCDARLESIIRRHLAESEILPCLESAEFEEAAGLRVVAMERGGSNEEQELLRFLAKLREVWPWLGEGVRDIARRKLDIEEGPANEENSSERAAIRMQLKDHFAGTRMAHLKRLGELADGGNSTQSRAAES